MSTVFRRGISTIIPPKVASPSLAGAKDAAKMARVVEFYKKLPRGAAPAIKPSGLMGRYRAKYFSGEKTSGMPIVHLILGLTLIGYTQQYYFHLRHHKNNAH